jgi:uncharacterized membrane protein SpoIIM required for sporulation
MQEAAFLKQNFERWKDTESLLEKTEKVNPDTLAHYFIQLTDDLAYAKTYYPDSKTVQYLNGITAKLHQKIYINKKEEKGRVFQFWKKELPQVIYASRKELLISFSIFVLAIIIGALSAANDNHFVRLILGDTYVNMTIANIEKGDPMAVYKQAREVEMFLGITLNNILVSFNVFIFGLAVSAGSAFILFKNGIMLGSFQYFFYEQGLLIDSMLAIWIHGTLEISAIVIAGAAGLVLGNGFLFPSTLSRLTSFRAGAIKGLKIIIGLIPIFITAGFLEGFVTRHTNMPIGINLIIIGGSLTFIIWYFIIYPYHLHKRSLKI